MSDEQAAAAAAEDPGLALPPASALRATWGLIAANVAVFILETFWGGSQWSPTLYRMGAIAGRESFSAEPWRVISSAFLHIGVVHLLLNMWALYVFGHFLEALLGPWRLLVLYGAAALGGGLASTLAHEQHLAAGASGAVWGLMLAEMVLILRPRVLFDDIVFTVNKWAVFQPLVFNLAYSLQPGIDLTAHLGGGVAGGLMMASGVLARDPGVRTWRPAAMATAAAMAACIALAFVHGRPWELRAPVLELRRLPTAPIDVPVPPGLPQTKEGETVWFGLLRRDPLVVECEPRRLEAPVAPAERRQKLEKLAREAAAQPLEKGMQREEAAAVVDVGGRPAYHHAVRYQNGARADLWYFFEGSYGLRLGVLQRPDLPEPWRAVPQRIASGVVFRPE